MLKEYTIQKGLVLKKGGCYNVLKHLEEKLISEGYARHTTKAEEKAQRKANKSLPQSKDS